MAKISAAMVKQLREMTNAPMMECKKALVEADGDLERAVDVLRTMGIAKAVKRAGRDTNEGTIASYLSEDSKVGALLELSCETDFVGTNPKFTAFARDLARVVCENDPSDVEALKGCAMGNATVADELTEMIHVIGENMKIVRFQRVSVENGALSSYVHLGGKLADIVMFSFSNAATAERDEFKTFAHDVAMQVAASAPVAAKREDVPAKTIEREKAIYIAQAVEAGKPKEFHERAANSKLEKFYKEIVLTEQKFIKDPSLTISGLTKQASTACNDSINIENFVRFSFGE